MKCARCLDPMTLFVVGDRYCQTCKREMRAQEPKAPVAQPIWLRRLTAKDMTSPYGGAA